MISQVDDDNSGEIEFAEFLKVIENQKTTAAKANDETDTLDAFIALGGHPDKTGEISTDKLMAVIKDFDSPSILQSSSARRIRTGRAKLITPNLRI